MADAKQAKAKSSKPASSDKDYVELRLPKFTVARVSLPIVVLLMIGSFLLGYFVQDIISPKSSVVAAADLSSSFSQYARDAKMDVGKFEKCFASNTHEKQVQEDIDAGMAASVNATPTFFINGIPLVGALPYEVFKSYLESELNGTAIPEEQLVSTDSARQEVEIGHLPTLGKKSTVTVVEFSDFQCPFCEQFFSNTWPQLKKEYIDTGKITFAYRHFPLTSIHPNAMPAAIAAECANEQGKFWEYHDLLFQNQKEWSDLTMSTPTQ